MASLLIVNADDFGAGRLATDRIEQCFLAGSVTSISAMVFMKDTARAAEMARARKLPVGLHLNLTDLFNDPSAPESVRERQARAVRHFANRRIARLTFNPVLARLIGQCISDQLACFEELFGGDPTHIDGHNPPNTHLSPTVLFSIPRGATVRTAEDRPNADARASAFARRVRHGLIAHRYMTTDRFLALGRLGAAPTSEEIQGFLDQARRESVEIMTHPEREHDYQLLMSHQWRSALQGHRLGSFADLRKDA